jgi:plastocyanin
MKLGTCLTTTLCAAALAGCGGGDAGAGPADPPPDARTIVATPSETFTPASLTVNAGDAVTFAFRSLAHNAFFDAQPGAPADIAGENANVSVQRTFATAGTYRYTCHIHPSMRGTVVVR